MPLLEKLSEVRKSGLTFAVETPSDAWQLSLNKEVFKEKLIEIIKEATCTEIGVGKYQCKDCNEDLGYQIIESGHIEIITNILKEPTCTIAGVGKVGCERCKESLGYVSLPITHTWGEVEVITPPTTSSPGKGKQQCTKCGEEQEVVIAIKEE